MLFAELLTGHLFITILADKSQTLLDAELARFMPDEILVPLTKLGEQYGQIFQSQGYVVSYEHYKHPSVQSEVSKTAADWFTQQFSQSLNMLQGANSLQPQSPSLGGAIELLYCYLKRNNEQGLLELKHLSFYKPEDYMMLDAITQRNLELVKNIQDGSSANTLFHVIDRAVTAMGSRMIKKWLLRPLIKKEKIEERLQAVGALVYDHAHKTQLRSLLQAIGDLERIVGRIALSRAQLYDYRALLQALEVVPEIKKLLVAKSDASLFDSIAAKLQDFSALKEMLNASLNDDTSKEWLIKQGYDETLDRVRKLVEQGAQAIYDLESAEQKKTGINSLKIRYNQVHGYGIEVTQPNLHLVPSHYLRVQTLANRERFTTQELKNLEHEVQRARNEINQIEREVFDRVKVYVIQWIPALKKLAHGLAYADALASLAEVAYARRYVRPTFNDEHAISIIDGRHPVIEARLQAQFIPNSVNLNDESSLWIITGPNMGGKSTFLRQVALITLLAQMGSFVPAAKANLTLVDRIFTRIGAADNMAEGKSTFLVEMEETALICNQATKQSLVILDEVGRGTSTFDGLALAQAVVEYIYQNIKARCLFATHYHELTGLCEKFPGIKPYYAASTKTNNGSMQRVVLLHKIMPGIADGSFGLEVAAVAQLPGPLIARAGEILQELMHMQHPALPVQMPHPIAPKRDGEYMIAAELAQIDCESLSAKQALDLVWRLKELLN